MTALPHPLFFAAQLVPSTGGPVKTIGAFQKALGGEIISFTDPRKLAAEGSGLPGILHVPSGTDPMRAWYLAPKGRIPDAVRAAEERATLVSCHVPFRRHFSYGAELARRRGIPYWVVPHGAFDPYVFTYRANFKLLWMEFVGRRILREARVVISSTTRSLLKTRRFGGKFEGVVIPWPVEPIDISDRALRRARQRSLLGIGPDERVILFLGRLADMKRPLEAIAAFSAVATKGTHLLVVGPEESVTIARAKVAARHVKEGRVHVLGPIFGDAKLDLLAASDAYVSLSYRENFGHSALEAMSAGLPTILSEGHDIIPDIGVGGIVRTVPNDEPTEWACAIKEFLHAPAERLIEIGAKARSWTLSELSPAAFSSRLRDLYAQSVVPRSVQPRITMSALGSIKVARPLVVGIGLLPANGGAYKSTLQFKQALNADVISFSEQGQERASGDAITHLWSGSTFWDRWFIRVSKRELARAAPLLATADLLQCHVLFRHHSHWVRCEARRWAMPYWVVPHGCLDPWVFTYRRWVKQWWMRIYGRAILRDAQAVIFATRREHEKARQWMARDNGRVVRWPVEAAKVRRSEAARVALRAQLGLPAASRVLCMLGRLHPMKRPLEAAVLFARHAPHGTFLLLVGPEGACSGASVVEAARAIDQTDRVRWIGPAFGKEKDQILAGCDGYWSYSQRENFNFAAAESMSAGLPVILSPGNDLSSEFDGASVGWTLESDEEQTVAVALKEWGTLPESSIVEIGDRARAWALSELSWERFETDLRALYREAIGESDL
jgi:glycosyltransferase involved in cell wall biosynthesis